MEKSILLSIYTMRYTIPPLAIKRLVFTENISIGQKTSYFSRLTALDLATIASPFAPDKYCTFSDTVEALTPFVSSWPDRADNAPPWYNIRCSC